MAFAFGKYYHRFNGSFEGFSELLSLSLDRSTLYAIQFCRSKGVSKCHLIARTRIEGFIRMVSKGNGIIAL